MSKLVWRKNNRAELGEKLCNPQAESLLLDPKLMVVVDHDPGKSDVSLLVLDGFFVSFPIGLIGETSGLV